MTARSKPRVERTAHFVRRSFFPGGTFVDLVDRVDAQRRAETWAERRRGCAWHHPGPPGRGVRGIEAPALGPAPVGVYDLPI